MTDFASASEKIASVSTDITFSPVSVNQEIRALVLDTINGTAGVGGIKGRLRAAARALGLTFDRVRRYHYGEVKRIEAHEADKIRHYAKIANHARLIRAHQEYAALRARVLAETPPGLEWLVPPALPDPAAAAPVATEGEPHE